ncbi:11240_t:CDS:1, partial [Racocetra persica]
SNLSTNILQNPFVRQRVLPTNLNSNDFDQYVKLIIPVNGNSRKNPKKIMGYHLFKVNVEKEGRQLGEEHPRVLEMAAVMIWKKCDYNEKR